MTDEAIKSHIQQALAAVVDKQKQDVSSHLDDFESKIAEGIQKMAPLMQLLNALKEEAGEVNGLDIDLAEAGHMATVSTRGAVTYDSYSVSTNYDNSKFTIEEFSTFDIDNSVREETHEYDTAEDVMTKVIKLVGEHIGSEQAHADRKNT